MPSLDITGTSKMCGLNPENNGRSIQYMDCIASPMFVYSQYLENCLHFPVWKNSCYLYYLISDPYLMVQSVLKLKEVCFSNVILFTYQCITAT